jgi:hypothetical protein
VADKPLTVLQAAFLDVVRPLPAGRTRTPAPAGARAHRREADPLEEHGCLHAAVIVFKGRRVWYPCRSHKGGVHRFLARLDACPAPWCRLPASHAIEGTMHDIPSGTVEIHDAIGAVDRG